LAVKGAGEVECLPRVVELEPQPDNAGGAGDEVELVGSGVMMVEPAPVSVIAEPSAATGQRNSTTLMSLAVAGPTRLAMPTIFMMTWSSR
jgi:hypothetical protein